MSDEAFLALKAGLSETTLLRRDEPLAKRTTLRVGGPADVYVEPGGEEELAFVIRFCGSGGWPWRVLGRGSNVIVRDGGVRGVVISLAHWSFCCVEVEGDRMYCGAGAKLKTVAHEARRHGLSGFEFLEGIPGTVGGALRMNAGAMGSWTFRLVRSVRLMDRAGEVREQPASELGACYRGCEFFREHIALGALFQGHPDSEAAVRQRMEACNQKRWETQPPQPSAGCIFKNPAGDSAGRLLDELGFKGRRVGHAVVSDVHANFIINEGGASAADVLALIERIKEEVRAQRGLELETEVEIIGDSL